MFTKVGNTIYTNLVKYTLLYKNILFLAFGPNVLNFVLMVVPFDPNVLIFGHL